MLSLLILKQKSRKIRLKLYLCKKNLHLLVIGSYYGTILKIFVWYRPKISCAKLYISAQNCKSLHITFCTEEYNCTRNVIPTQNSNSVHWK